MNDKASRNKSKQKGPAQFEKRGNAYIGYATALQNAYGNEILIMAPTIEQLRTAAEALGHPTIDEKLVRRCALGPESMADKKEIIG